MHLKWLPLELQQLQLLQLSSKPQQRQPITGRMRDVSHADKHTEGERKLPAFAKDSGKTISSSSNAEEKESEGHAAKGIEQRSLPLTGGVVLRKWLQASRSAFNAFWGQPRGLCLPRAKFSVSRITRECSKRLDGGQGRKEGRGGRGN